MNKIEFRNINKSYGNKKILDDISFDVLEGEFVVIIGESGSGKTTLLKAINRLEPIDSGKICIDGKDIEDVNIEDLRRNIGYVIQNVGLMPHMNIKDNINYVLDLLHKDKSIKDKRAKELIELINLDENYLYKKPSSLSGGQKQRVGVARALAASPSIVLMDEPFSAIDEITRNKLQDEILELQKKLNLTIVFITHDINEALKLGDKIILIKEGKIEQIGNKEDIVFNPATDYVKEFIGIKGLETIMGEEKLRDFYNKTLEENRIEGDL